MMRLFQTAIRLCVVLAWAVVPHIADAEEPISGVTLTVNLVGVKGTNGRICAALFDRADAFPEGKHIRSGCAAINGGTAEVVLKGISPGTYAVSAFHDANSDGKVNTNFLGIPKEGTGASRDAKAKMGPPKFSDAKFEVGKADMKIQITLKYM